MNELIEMLLNDPASLIKMERERLLVALFKKASSIRSAEIRARTGRRARCATGLSTRISREAQLMNAKLDVTDLVILAFKLEVITDPNFDLDQFQEEHGYDTGYADALLQMFFDATPLPYFSSYPFADEDAIPPTTTPTQEEDSDEFELEIFDPEDEVND